jgi:superfamily II DNA or RNA helicase
VSESSEVPVFRATAAAEHLSPSFPERAPWGTVAKLRAWQEEALAEYLRRDARDFLVSATPGAGKTAFALRLASELLKRKVIDRVTVVAPTEHLKIQWGMPRTAPASVSIRGSATSTRANPARITGSP